MLAGQRLARVDAQLTSVSTAADFREGTNSSATPIGKDLLYPVHALGKSLQWVMHMSPLRWDNCILSYSALYSDSMYAIMLNQMSTVYQRQMLSVCLAWNCK
jgi:hypothetical protein